MYPAPRLGATAGVTSLYLKNEGLNRSQSFKDRAGALIESGGQAITASDEEILEAICDVARHSGVFVEPSCACAWACLKKLAAAKRVEKDERIVCLMTGSGLKDIANARKVAGEPTVIDPDVDAALVARISGSCETVIRRPARESEHASRMT